MHTLSDTYCLKKGIRLKAGAIKWLSYTTNQACKEECGKTKGCVAFSTVAEQCRLKNKTHEAETSTKEVISARMSCYEGNHHLDAPFT